MNDRVLAGAIGDVRTQLPAVPVTSVLLFTGVISAIRLEDGCG